MFTSAFKGDPGTRISCLGKISTRDGNIHVQCQKNYRSGIVIETIELNKQICIELDIRERTDLNKTTEGHLQGFPTFISLGQRYKYKYKSKSFIVTQRY